MSDQPQQPQQNDWLSLRVTVIEARGLRAGDRISSKSDPYVVLKCNSEKHATKVKHKELNPVWNETFTFGQRDELLGDEVLMVHVKDKDLFGADILGSCEVDLSSIPVVQQSAAQQDKNAEREQSKWYALQAPRKGMKAKGKVHLQFKWMLESAGDGEIVYGETEAGNGDVHTNSKHRLELDPRSPGMLWDDLDANGDENNTKANNPGTEGSFLLDFTILDLKIEQQNLEGMFCVVKSNNEQYHTRTVGHVNPKRQVMLHHNCVFGRTRSIAGNEYVTIHVHAKAPGKASRLKNRGKLASSIQVGVARIKLCNEMGPGMVSEFGIPPTSIPIHGRSNRRNDENSDERNASGTTAKKEPLTNGGGLVVIGSIRVAYNCLAKGVTGIPRPSHAKELHITVHAGRNLKRADFMGKADPYIVARCKQQVFRTKTKRKTLNPVWNQTFVFGGYDAELPVFTHDTLLLELRDKDLMSSEHLGSVVIPLDTFVNGQPKWFDVLEEWSDVAPDPQGNGQVQVTLTWEIGDGLTSPTARASVSFFDKPINHKSGSGAVLVPASDPNTHSNSERNGQSTHVPDKAHLDATATNVFPNGTKGKNERRMSHAGRQTDRRRSSETPSKNNVRGHVETSHLPHLNEGNMSSNHNAEQGINSASSTRATLRHCCQLQLTSLEALQLPSHVRLVQLKALKVQCCIVLPDGSQLTTTIPRSTGLKSDFLWDAGGASVNLPIRSAQERGVGSDQREVLRVEVRVMGTGEFGTPLHIGAAMLVFDVDTLLSQTSGLSFSFPICASKDGSALGSVCGTAVHSSILATRELHKKDSNGVTLRHIPDIRRLIQNASYGEDHKLDMLRLLESFDTRATGSLNMTEMRELLEHVGVGHYLLRHECTSLVLNMLRPDWDPTEEEDRDGREGNGGDEMMDVDNVECTIESLFEFALARNADMRDVPLVITPTDLQIKEDIQEARAKIWNARRGVVANGSMLVNYAENDTMQSCFEGCDDGGDDPQSETERRTRESQRPTSERVAEKLFDGVYSSVQGENPSMPLGARLLDGGANANWKHPVGGWTALHMAAGAGKAEVVIWLLSNGACVDAADEFGKMPEDYANESGHVDLARALARLRHGASLGGNGGVVVSLGNREQGGDEGSSTRCATCAKASQGGIGEIEQLAKVAKQHKREKREAVNKVKERARQAIKALRNENAKLIAQARNRTHTNHPGSQRDWFDADVGSESESTPSFPLPQPPPHRSRDRHDADNSDDEDIDTQPSFYMYQADYLRESTKRHNKPAKPAPRTDDNGATSLPRTRRSSSSGLSASPVRRTRRGSDPGPQTTTRRSSVWTRTRRASTLGLPVGDGRSAKRRESCAIM